MQKGDFVRIDFVGRLESREIFDLTKESLAKENNIHNPGIKYKPVPIIIGAGFVVPGLEKALLDMKTGEKKEITVKPEDGFGERKPELVRTVPEKAFENKKVVPGMVVDFGNNMRGRVQSMSAGRVRIDFNHPLAGKMLKYEVELKEHITDEIQQVEAILDFFGIEPKLYYTSGTFEIEAEIPPVLKKRISSLILQYVKDVNKIRFVQSFQKEENPTEENAKPVKEKKLKE
jgi:FKBP-type peptidyl-prolyl cis-trans isomerase 2